MRANFESPMMRPRFFRDIGDVAFADKRQQVVLADRIQRDVAHEHQLVVAARVKKLEVLLRVRLQPRENLRIHARNAGGRLLQPLALRVLADRKQDLPHGPFNSFQIHRMSVSFPDRPVIC